ncbi:MAG TPA: hypothetical protein VKX96_14290, partial [Chloroflexota bacterium]|nr:hypothetical protein [Chloroflexota bacterium]
ALDPGRSLKDYVQSNRYSMLAVLEYVVGPGREDPEIPTSHEERTKIAEALAIEKRLADRLGPLRNRAVHEAGGASCEMIKDKYSLQGQAQVDLLGDLEKLTRLAGGVVDGWGIERVRQALQRTLGE